MGNGKKHSKKETQARVQSIMKPIWKRGLLEDFESSPFDDGGLVKLFEVPGNVPTRNANENHQDEGSSAPLQHAMECVYVSNVEDNG